jgi:hypothetical protein
MPKPEGLDSKLKLESKALALLESKILSRGSSFCAQKLEPRNDNFPILNLFTELKRSRILTINCMV